MCVLKKTLAAILLSFTLLLFSCGRAELSGTFIPKGKSRVASIEFKDGNARFTDSFLGIKQGCMEFYINDGLVNIKHPVTGIMVFKIVDADTLLCDVPGMHGVYTRLK